MRLAWPELGAGRSRTAEPERTDGSDDLVHLNANLLCRSWPSNRSGRNTRTAVFLVFHFPVRLHNSHNLGRTLAQRSHEAAHVCVRHV